MDFGLFAACHRFDESGSTAEVYEQALEMVELADEAGFRVAWFPEHHLIHYISCPSPLMMVVQAASRTRRIRLGTAILVIPYYNPLRLAGEIGMADVLTGGRLEIGVGRGAFEYEFDRFGIDETIAAARLRDGMAIVRGLLTEEDFSYQGETCSFGPATAVPRPLQSPCPPIWVAARSPDTITWAIRNGYNLLSTPWREPFARVEALYAQVRALTAEVAPPVSPRFAVSRMTFVGATDGEALDAMNAIRMNHRMFTGLFRNQADVKAGFTSAGAGRRRVHARAAPGQPGGGLAGDVRGETEALRGARCRPLHHVRGVRRRPRGDHEIAPPLRGTRDAALH